MCLDEYQKKRDFVTSPEPKGDNDNNGGNSSGNSGGNGSGDNVTKIFVIQEHHASHLHWDLRLEIGRTLRSWAVPKEPPTVEGVKRLAIQVEDHPIEYANFEGTIPAGMYGAGSVKIWDKGEFSLEEESENRLTFELKGKRMIGKYNLIKVPKMGKNSWLLFKKIQF